MILFHLITECDGYRAIEQIAQQHETESISNLAYQLTKYNINMCQKCNNISSEISMEFMQQWTYFFFIFKFFTRQLTFAWIVVKQQIILWFYLTFLYNFIQTKFYIRNAYVYFLIMI